MSRPVSSNTRVQILESAHALVLEQGAPDLTLEAVAARAGISKGGLLYHFGSKDALLRGMLQAQLEGFQAQLEAARDGLIPGEFTRAFVQATFSAQSPSSPSGSALLAVVAHKPELLEVVAQHYREWQRALECDGLPDGIASLVRFAADGLYFAELFGMAPLTGAARAQLISHLLELASPTRAGERS